MTLETHRKNKELALHIAAVVSDFAYYGFDLSNPDNVRKLAEEWILPELKKYNA